MVTLRTLGDCRIHTPEGVIRPRASQLFGLATYLIVERGSLIPRRRLTTLFWPDRSVDDARPLLREALRKLRRKGIPIVGDDDALHVRLPKTEAQIDVYDFAVPQLRDAAAHSSALLSGYEPDSSPQLRDWIDDLRDRLRATLVTKFSEALEQARLRAEWETVLELAGQTLTVDPEHMRAQEMAAYARRLLDGRRGISGWGSPGSYGTLIQDGTGAVTTTMVREIPPVYESAPASSDTTLVGRADDLALLTAALHRAKTGAGGGCYLYGPPGIGKSRLVRELVRIAKPDGLAIRATTCQPQDAQRPLSVFVDMIPGLRELPGASGCFPHTHAYLDRLTRHGTTVSVPDAEAREGEQLYEHIRRALFDLVEAVTDEQPVLFIVENVQWSDPQSWALLRDLSARAIAQAILFVFTSREPWRIATDGPPPSYLTGQRIDAIAPEAARQHAEEYASALPCLPDEAMLAWCVRTAEGNPYFIEELLNHWAATGKQFSAPETLMALINTRIQGLSDTSLRLLQASAVLNKNSTLVRLRSMLEYPEYQFLTAVEELVRAGMLTTELSTGTGVYNQVMCRHDILADQALQQLSPPGRQWLHHRAGTILDSELDSRAATMTMVWDCAQHWHVAGNTERAVRLGLVCATHLMEVGLARDAATVCRNTIEFCSTDIDRLNTTVVYVRALFFTNEFLEIPRLLREIQFLRASLGQDPSPHDDIEILGIETGWILLHNTEDLLAQATRCVETSSIDLAHRLQAGLTLLKIGANTGDFEIMHRVYQTLAPEITRTPFPEDEVSLTFEVIYNAVCGDLVRCSVVSNRLIEFARERLSGSRLRRALLNGANGLSYAGHRTATDAIYEEVFEEALKVNASYQATHAVQELIWNNMIYGNFTAAKGWIRRIEKLNRPANERWGRINLTLNAATVAFYEGDIAEIDMVCAPQMSPQESRFGGRLKLA